MMETFSTFNIQQRLGWFTSDNAMNNDTAMNALAGEYLFDPTKRRVRCIGHILNLIAQSIMIGTQLNDDGTPLTQQQENLLRDDKTQAKLWRSRGSVRKLHNIVVYICASIQRIEAFTALQQHVNQLTKYSNQGFDSVLYALVRDNDTRQNSIFEMIARALHLQDTIEQYIATKKRKWYEYEQMYNERIHKIKRNNPNRKTLPKKKEMPKILLNELTPNDWLELRMYWKILRPIKDLTIKLQGQPGRHGCIYQVIPKFLKIKEHLHQVLRELGNVKNAGFADEALHSTGPITQDVIQDFFHQPSLPLSNKNLQAFLDASEIRTESSDLDPFIAKADDIWFNWQGGDKDGLRNSRQGQAFELHYQLNLKRGLKKLDTYWEKILHHQVYSAAVILNPNDNIHWFKRKRTVKGLDDEPPITQQIFTDAEIKIVEDNIRELWQEYKGKENPYIASNQSLVKKKLKLSKAIENDHDMDIYDSSDEEEQKRYLGPPDDELDQYLKQAPFANTARLQNESSKGLSSPLITWWWGKRNEWPALSMIAIDILSIPPMSDEPERTFSETGCIVTKQRNRLKEGTIQSVAVLKSWLRWKVINLDNPTIVKAQNIKEFKKHENKVQDTWFESLSLQDD